MTIPTPAPGDLDAFETRLLVELRREVAEPAPAQRRTRRALGLAAGVAATAVVGVVLVPGLGTTPAYSVQEGNAGEITVEVNRPEDAAGLERALAEHGIDADVTYLPALQTCAPGRYTEVDREVGMSLSIGTDLVRVTLAPGAVRDDETFVMVLSVEPVTDGMSSSVLAEVARGPVGACDPVPSPGTS
jgi:hypothetical protein